MFIVASAAVFIIITFIGFGIYGFELFLSRMFGWTEPNMIWTLCTTWILGVICGAIASWNDRTD